MGIVLAVLGASTVLAAGCKRSPVPMRYACATGVKGRMRYVQSPRECRAGERVIHFAAGSSDPVYACTSVKPRLARLGGPDSRRFLIPAGATWKALGPQHCRPDHQQRVELDGESAVSFCAAVDEGGVLRHLGAGGHCRKNEIEVFVAAHGRFGRADRHPCPPARPPKVAPNLAPTLTVPSAQTLNENASIAFSAAAGNRIAVADADSDGGIERLTLGVSHGALTPGSTGSLHSDSGSGTDTLVLEGTIAALDEALEGLSYSPAHGYYGPDALELEADDLGHTGAGGAQTAKASVAISVERRDQAPANTVPLGQTIGENQALRFSAMGADAISVEDADSEGGVERVTLGVQHGSLTPGSTGNLHANSGSGTGTLVLEGTIAALNEALQGLAYVPAHNYHGADTLSLATDDLGNTGAGGPLTSTSEVPIAVTAVVYDTAVNDSYNTDEDEKLEVAAPGVLANDTDSDAPPLPLEVQEVTVQPQHGTVSVQPNGSFVYTPDHLFVGEDSFSYEDTDGNTPSNEATVTVHIEGRTFDHAESESYTVHEDARLEVAAPGVLGNDTDSEGLPLEARLVSTTAHGTLSLAANGSFEYEPDAGFSGSDSFVYRDYDGNSYSNEVTDTIEVEHIDRAPVNTVPGAQTVPENGAVSFKGPGDAISVEDVDSEGGVERVTLRVEHGSLTPGSTSGLASSTGSGTGSLVLEGTIAALNEALEGLVYTPVHDYHEADTLSIATDDLGHTGLDGPLTTTSEVPITVSAVVYDTAVNDSYPTAEDETLEVAAPGVLANDTDADTPPLPLEVQEVTVQPQHGSVSVQPNGSFVYTPDHLFYGEDSFSYVDTDGNIESNEATVTVTVEKQVFDHAVDHSYMVHEDAKLEVAAPGVLEGDTDSEGLSLTAEPVGQPAHGKLSLSSNGSFDYEPEAGFSGSDSFTYRVNDGNSPSNEATVTIEVQHVDRAPVNTVPGAQTVPENGALSFESSGMNAISVQDVDSDGGVERVTLGVQHGSLTPGSTSGLASSTGSGTGTLVLEGTITALNEALEGLAYTPAHNYHGSDALSVDTDDLGHTGFGGSLTAESTVPITVSAVVYDTAVNDSYNTGEDEKLEVAAPGVLANDTDSDTPPLPLEVQEVTAQPQHGTVSVQPNGSFVYTPNKLFVGEDSFRYKDSDGNTESNESTVTVHVEGRTFDHAVDDSYSVLEDQKLEVDEEEGVLANDTDSEGLQLEAKLVSTTSHGTLSLATNGAFSYEPQAGYSGEDSFTYRDDDGNTESNEATVTIEVRVPHVNEAPTVSLPGAQTVAESTPTSPTSLTFSAAKGDAISVADADADGGNEQVKLAVDNGTLKLGTTSGLSSSEGNNSASIKIEGTIASLNSALEGLEYAPRNEYAGSDSLAVEINDLGHTGSGGEKTASGTVAITVVNPAPTPTNPTYTGEIGNTEMFVGESKGGAAGVEDSGSVLPSPATGPDGSTLTVKSGAIATKDGGEVNMKENGTFTYVPPVGHEGSSDSFEYEEKDSLGGHATGIATIDFDDARVWYVNDSETTNGNGESNKAFNSLAAVSSAAGSGDYIFLYKGGSTYAGGIVLKSDQTLVGQDVGLKVESETLLTGTAGSNPVIGEGSGVGITLASGDKVDGVTVTKGTRYGIFGENVSGVTIEQSKVNESGTEGHEEYAGIDLQNPSGADVISSTTVTGSKSDGIRLFGEGGDASLAVTKDEVTEAKDTGIDLISASGASTFDIAGNTLTKLGERGIWVRSTETGASGSVVGEIVKNTTRETTSTGIEVNANGSQTVTASVDENTVTHVVSSYGIVGNANEGSSPTLNLTALGDEVDMEGLASAEAFDVDSGVIESDKATVCLHAAHDKLTASGLEADGATFNSIAMYVGEEGGKSILDVQGTDGATSETAVQASLEKENPELTSSVKGEPLVVVETDSGVLPAFTGNCPVP